MNDPGPIDVVVIGCTPGAPVTGDAVPILLDLVDRADLKTQGILTDEEFAAEKARVLGA
jgi:hypothetical protein